MEEDTNPSIIHSRAFHFFAELDSKVPGWQGMSLADIDSHLYGAGAGRGVLCRQESTCL